jgi:hypothetical protein
MHDMPLRTDGLERAMNVERVFVLLPLFAAATFVRATPPQAEVVQATWQVALDAKGDVTDVIARSSEMPKLYSKLEPVLRTWKFKPGQIDGQATETRTFLHLVLRLETKGNEVDVRVLGAATGGSYGHVTRPAFPDLPGWGRKEGGVMLRVHYDESGKVTSAEPYEADQRPDPFVQAAKSSVMSWTFSPETVGGHAIASDVLVPICYQLSPYREPASCKHRNPATGKAMTGSESLALNPAATLQTDVIGKIL